MPVEIEKKFLLAGNAWRQNAVGSHYCQGYISTATGCTVRVRIAGNTGFLTIKGKGIGIVRPEFEYAIPVNDAREMLDSLCTGPLIEKMRYKVDYKGFTWEIDDFSGENEGLVIAEIELSREDEYFEKPPWIGREVTGDPRYFNARLVNNPFSKWKTSNQ